MFQSKMIISYQNITVHVPIPKSSFNDALFASRQYDKIFFLWSVEISKFSDSIEEANFLKTFLFVTYFK